MEYRRPKGSPYALSEIGLGTNNFGSRLDEAQSRAVVNTALDLGINFFDTADVYGSGTSEEFLGKALGARRQDVVVATKVGRRTDDTQSGRGGSKHWILKSIEGSLRRLGTDWIDVYQVHVPDHETPILETLDTLDELVRSGKVRSIGTSNFAAWELVDADWTSRVNGLARPVVAQYVWNLVEREAEATVLPAARHLDLGLIAARPLAYGLLTGKFDGTSDLSGARLPGSKRAGELLTNENDVVVRSLTAFAAAHGRTVLELALGYLLSEAQVVSVIASASSPEQLRQNVHSATWRVAPEERRAVDEILPAIASGQPNS